MHLRLKKLIPGLAALFALPAFVWAGTRESIHEIIQIQSPSAEQLELLPKNLTRWHLGATLLLPAERGFETISFRDHRNRPERALMDDDDTTGLHLEAGTHHFIVDLNNFIAVGRFASLSLGAEGSLTVRSSDTLQALDSGRWTQLGRNINFRSDDWIDIRFPLTETRFLWVQIDIRTPGVFGSFNAKGMLNLANVGLRPATTEATTEDMETMPFDYARLYAGARITHVSGGDPRIANFLIDDDILTYYEFPPGQAEPIFVLDLGDTRQAEFVSLLLESGPGHLDIFYTNRNPFGDSYEAFEAEDRLTFLANPATGQPVLLASTGPVLSARGMQFAQTSRFRSVEVPSAFMEDLGRPISVEVEAGKRTVNIPLPAAPFRFLVVRWRTETELPFGLRIFELSVIGSVPAPEPPVQIHAIPPAEAMEFAALASFKEGPLERIPPVERTLPPERPEIVLPDDPPVSL